MARGEVGARPLLLNVIKRYVGYTNSIKMRPDSTVYSSFDFESKNDHKPNFCSFIKNFDFIGDSVFERSKSDLTRVCHDNYDRFWWGEINNSPKARTFLTFKQNVVYEKYLNQIENHKHRTSLSRFRLSNHDLMIEKGRHMRPRIDPDLRKCFNCTYEIEDEFHFVTKCPLYAEERTLLFDCCKQNSIHFELLTDAQKFVFYLYQRK